MHPEDDSPEQLTLKTSGAYVWDSLRAPGNGDSILKDAHKMPCTPSPSAEEAVLKDPGSDPLADSRAPPKEAKGTCPGDRIW